MTKERAIEILERRTTIPDGEYTWEQINQAIDMAISALRSVSREQVEKVWREECDCTKTKACCTCCAMRCQCCIRQSEYKQASFCMKCGRPLTNEAVQMVMERINEMEAS